MGSLQLLNTAPGRPGYFGQIQRAFKIRILAVHQTGQVPDNVEAVFAKALAVAPADRHADVGVFWKELKEVASKMSNETENRLSLDAIVGTGTTIYGAPLSGRPDAIITPPLARRPAAVARKRTWLTAVLVSLPLVAAMVGGAFFFLRSGGDDVVHARTSGTGISAAFEIPTSVPDASAARAKTLPEGWLTVLCTPYCSDIELDGRSLGPSPVLTAKVEPGRRELAVHRDGTPSKRMKLLIRTGASREVSVSMDP
jgi:hypothetical protein